MRLLATLSFLAPTLLFAQTTWNVEIGGSLLGLTQPYYAPQDLDTIQVGDIVHWSCVSGKHNVYGNTDIFPDNPMGFTSGSPANSPWTFDFTFTVPGVYDYHCTQTDHAITQFGHIVVAGPTGIVPPRKSSAISIFPVPATDHLVLDLKGCTGSTGAQIVNADGRTLREVPIADGKLNTIDLQGLPAGQYYLLVARGLGTRMLRFVKM